MINHIKVENAKSTLENVNEERKILKGKIKDSTDDLDGEQQFSEELKLIK